MTSKQTDQSNRVRERSRQRILKTARRLLARHGYDGATMDQIAQEAGTSIGNLYFYFRNKEALLEAVVMSQLAENGSRVDARLADIPSGPLAVAVGMYTYLEALFEDPDMARIFVVGERHHNVRRKLIGSIIDRIRRRLPQHIHEMKETEAELTAVAEVGAVFSLVEAQLSGSIDVTPDRFFRFLTRLRLRIFGLPLAEEDATIAKTEEVVGWVEGRSWSDLRTPRSVEEEADLVAGS